MKLTAIDVQSLRIPTVRNHEMAIGTTTQQENVVVALADTSGNVGYGEAPHMVGHSQDGETPGTVRVVLRDKLVPAMQERGFETIEGLSMTLDHAVPRNLRAKGAVVMAAFDLVGKQLGIPVHALLGGAVRERIELSWSLPIQGTDRVVEEAISMKERGWRILKVKTGRPTPESDAEVVMAVRDAVGPELDLRVDANQAYDVKTAIRFARLVEPANLTFFEQPVKRRDLRGMAEVRAATDIPIMADESAMEVRDIVDLGLTNAADCVSIYVIGPGGLNRSKDMATVAGAFGMKGYVGGALESSIGAAAGLHFAASCPAVSLGCEMTGLYLLSDSIAETVITFEDGCLEVPSGPGLGIDVSPEKLAQYRIGEVENFTI